MPTPNVARPSPKQHTIVGRCAYAAAREAAIAKFEARAMTRKAVAGCIKLPSGR